MNPFSLKKVALAALSFWTLLGGALPAPVSSTDAPAKRQPSGYKNMVYYTDWSVFPMWQAVAAYLFGPRLTPPRSVYGRNYQVSQLPASQLTHVLYAFANIRDTGEVFLADTFADTDKHFAGDCRSDLTSPAS